MDASVTVFLEGLGDENFFDSVLRGELAKRYNVKTRPYAEEDKETLAQSVDTLHKIKRDYIVFVDFDRSACYTQRKETLHKIPNARHGSIAVVKTEIGSWYLAGTGTDECALLQIPHLTNTESVSKEDFEGMLARRVGVAGRFRGENPRNARHREGQRTERLVQIRVGQIRVRNRECARPVDLSARFRGRAGGDAAPVLRLAPPAAPEARVTAPSCPPSPRPFRSRLS